MEKSQYRGLSFINTTKIIQHRTKIGKKIYPAKLTGKVTAQYSFTKNITGKLLYSTFSLMEIVSFHVYSHTYRERLVHRR